MTEAEWLASSDPKQMLRPLYGNASGRKLRLFAVACCRRLPSSVIRPENGGLVDLAERHADGLLPLSALVAASGGVAGMSTDTWPIPEGDHLAYARTDAAEAIGACLGANPFRAAENAATSVSYAVADLCFSDMDGQEWSDAERKEAAAQAGLLRDLFYDLHRPPPFHRVWLSHDVMSLARVIYDEQNFERLPALADALEKTGCKAPALLDHCRRPGPHIRGCWVVDLILGKN